MKFKLPNYYKVLAIMPLVLPVSACVSDAGSEYVNEPGYIAGFSDGCSTAREAEKSFSTKRVRNDNAYSEDKAYQVGWRAGLLQCDFRDDDETSLGGRILGEDQNF